MNLKKIFAGMALVSTALFSCATLISCGNSNDTNPGNDDSSDGETKHSHTFAKEWSYDDTYHYHSPECNDTTEVADKATHIFVDDACILCGYDKNANASYKVTFNSNGGSDVSSLEVKRNFVITKPSNPKKEGYTFDGWYSDSSLEEEWNFETDKVKKNITLYAKWSFVEKTYTAYVGVNSDYVKETKTTKNGRVIYEPEKEGYKFMGWYSDEKLTNKWDNTDEVLVNNLVLYSKFISEEDFGEILDAPSVSINDETFKWDKVEKATSYDILLYNASDTNTVLNEENVTTNYWNFPSSLGSGNYIFKIRSCGDGINTINSTYYKVYYTHRVLGNVSNINLDISTSILSWNKVKNAYCYMLYIDNELIDNELYYPSYDMSNYEAGSHSVKIEAYNSSYKSSSTTTKVTKYRLKTPELNLYLNPSDNSYILSWDRVEGATSYIIKYDGSDEEIKITSNTYTIKGDSAMYKNGEIKNVVVYAYNDDKDYLKSFDSAKLDITKTYTLSIDSSISGAGSESITGSKFDTQTTLSQSFVVTFDYGYDNIKTTQTVTSSEGLTYPSIPKRNGYLFRGWFKDNAVYDFTQNVDENIVLTAMWQNVSSDLAYPIDITSYNSSSNAYSITTAADTNKYVYFTCLKGGTYRFYYKVRTSGSDYDVCWRLYNVTKGDLLTSYIMASTSTSYCATQFSCNKGDVIELPVWKGNNYTNTFYFYIEGVSVTNSLPTGGGKCENINVIKQSSSTTNTLQNNIVASNTSISLNATANAGYEFVGWYDGDTLISADAQYTFDMPQKDVKYTAKYKAS